MPRNNGGYMRDSDGARIDAVPILSKNPDNVGCRIFGGRMGTFNNNSGTITHQIGAELATRFLAVRPIIANSDPSIAHRILVCKASSPTTRADINNSGGTWVQGQRMGANSIYVPAPQGALRCVYGSTDWIPLRSSARSDGGQRPLVTIRVIMDSSSVLPVVGNGTDDFTNWATRTDGRMWSMRRQSVDGVTTPTAFTSTTDVSQSPIVGVQYLGMDGRIVNVAMTGDSNGEGRGTYLGEGMLMPVLEDLSSSAVAFEYMNTSWSGQASSDFYGRAIDLMHSSVKPDLIVTQLGTPNDVIDGQPILQSTVDDREMRRSRLIMHSRKTGVPVLFHTWMPTDSEAYGTSDSIRRAVNAQWLAQSPDGALVADVATAVKGATVGGQERLKAAYTTDLTHLNDAGNVAAGEVLKPFITSILSRSAA